MALGFRKGKVHEAESREHSGGWYPDPCGTAARRWFDNVSGWSERVEGAGTSIFKLTDTVDYWDGESGR